MGANLDAEDGEGQEGGDQPEHELTRWLRQDEAEMQSEYLRIRDATPEDPGTAGDEGEEVWAGLLRQWLPEAYSIVTKGRLLSADGKRGPQVDVIVLRPGYPTRLMTKKVYLLGGVAAAFECKNTLKTRHLSGVFERAARMDDLAERVLPTPVGEMLSSVPYGLLAHSTEWTSSPDSQRQHVDSLLQDGLMGMAGFRKSPDLVCVADLATWTLIASPYYGPALMPPDTWREVQAKWSLRPEGHASCGYARYVEGIIPDSAPPNPIAVLIPAIMRRIARHDHSIRPLADYFMATGLSGSGRQIAERTFGLDTFSSEVRASIPGSLVNGQRYSDWSMVFY